MIGHDPERGTAENYRRFAALEARGRSPLYDEFATGVANDLELLAYLESLPRDKRQPNLLLCGVVVQRGSRGSFAPARLPR